MADRFQRSTRKLSSSGQTSSSPDGLAGDVEVTGGGNTGWRRESAWSGLLGLEGVDRSTDGETSAGLGRADCQLCGRSDTSRQSSSSSNSQSIRSPTQRPIASKREAPSRRSKLRRPGLAPETPSTSWRPVSNQRSSRRSKGSGLRCERCRRESMHRRYRRLCCNQRSRCRPISTIETPPASNTQRKTSIPLSSAPLLVRSEADNWHSSDPHEADRSTIDRPPDASCGDTESGAHIEDRSRSSAESSAAQESGGAR